MGAWRTNRQSRVVGPHLPSWAYSCAACSPVPEGTKMTTRSLATADRTPHRWRSMRSRRTPLFSLTPMFLAARHDLAEKTERSYTDQFTQFDAWIRATNRHAATLEDLDSIAVDAYVGHRLQHGIRAG